MRKISYVKIDGEEYPLSLSMSTLKNITEKYEGIEEWFDSMGKADMYKKIDLIIDMIFFLIKDGVKYTNYKNDTEEKYPPRDILATLVGYNDLDELTQAIQAVVVNNSESIIKIKPKKPSKKK